VVTRWTRCTRVRDPLGRQTAGDGRPAETAATIVRAGGVS